MRRKRIPGIRANFPQHSGKLPLRVRTTARDTKGMLMNKIVRIGSFFGGSFGVAGNPTQVYDYYAVDSDINDATKSSDKCALVAFCSASEAHDRMQALSCQIKTLGKK